MNKLFTANIREQLGGKNSLNLEALLYLAPNTVICSVLEYWHLVEEGNLASLLFANAISLLVCYFLYLFFKNTAYRNRAKKPTSLVWVASYGLAMGYAKEYVTLLVLWQMLRFESFPDYYNLDVLGASLLGVFVMPSLSMATSLMEKFRENRNLLITAKFKERLEGSKSTPSAKTQKNLKAFISSATDRLSGATSSANLVEALRDLNDNKLRPLSHKLWKEESAGVAGYSRKDLQLLVLKDYLFSSKYIGLVNFLFTALFTVPHFGIAQGLAFSGLSGAFLWLSFWMANKVKVQKSRFVFLRAFAVLAVNVLFDAAIFPLLHPDQDDRHLVIGTLLNAIWLLTLVYAIGFAKASLATNDDIQQKLGNYFAQNATLFKISSGQASAMNREFAEYLHSDVQNKLLQTALLAESTELTTEQVLEQVKKVSDYLNEIENNFFDQTVETAVMRIQNLPQTWSGVIAVKVDLPEYCKQSLEKLSAIESTLLLRAINEAIANSLRHGLASVSSVNFQISTNSLEIDVVDNGTGPKARMENGLGTNLFQDLCDGNWSLTADKDGGARLHLSIALA